MNTDIEVLLIPVLSDNYAYLIHLKKSNRCLLIDPGEAAPILNFLKNTPYILSQIWITHFHSDHVGGILEIQKETHCEVLGPKNEADLIPGITKTVSDLDILHFGSHKVKVFSLPGHTLGHIVYWFYEDNLLFSGDTLFSLGCGFLFEGTAHQMWTSLLRIRCLPKETLIYCGHEYSQKNAKFALSVDPENKELIEFAKEIEIKRSRGLPTLPTLLEKEILTNPFLRADLPCWKKLLKNDQATPDEVFEFLRAQKNTFK